ncbi:uncharacterized protein FIBRA_08999 [Fibroporia radiculosa]|uniref:Uncharacterized protein n=1 Tax=Fibroporia radiculosa TaxID=599839 RepID=J4H5G7_9APHY|nr:uncharacterized protein FIBRA_08999 [Fibroporia radiculosa]CCM06709.1 predicted protein [Fibroporia radiculosa]
MLIAERGHIALSAPARQMSSSSARGQSIQQPTLAACLPRLNGIPPSPKTIPMAPPRNSSPSMQAWKWSTTTSARAAAIALQPGVAPGSGCSSPSYSFSTLPVSSPSSFAPDAPMEMTSSTPTVHPPVRSYILADPPLQLPYIPPLNTTSPTSMAPSDSAPRT